MKDSLINIWLGFFGVKSILTEIKTKLKNLFGELDLEDPEVLDDLKNVIMFWSNND